MLPSYAEFPGLHISRCDMVYTHGVTPSVCQLTAVVEDISNTYGDLILANAGVPVIRFRDCALDRAWDSPPYVKRGQRINLRLLDRRWRWKGARINGRYNVRRPDCIPLPSTKKSYKELVELLLGALGELSDNINIPCGDSDGPTVEWTCARADLELAALVESVGCLVILGLDDLVHIVPNGAGEVFPPTRTERILTKLFNPATAPWKVRVEYGPNRYQSSLLLEAVGIERDGSVVPIDELSYKPSGGWRLQVPGVYNDVANKEDRVLARESVYRWYRINSQGDGTISLPGSTETISAITDILPLSEDLILPIESIASESDNSSIVNYPPAKARVYGQFWDGDMKGVDAAYNAGAVESTYWDDAFFLDKERGIVKFHEYMFCVASDYHHDPAILKLHCSYCARANPNSALYHYEVDLETGVGKSVGSGVALTERKDLFKFVAAAQLSASQTIIKTNETNLKKHGTEVATSFVNTYLDRPQCDQQWPGILPYSLAGNIHQLRWVIGNESAMTYGSRSSEVPHWGPTYRERRIREEVDRSLFP